MRNLFQRTAFAAIFMLLATATHADSRYEAAYRLLEVSQLEQLLEASIEESLLVELDQNPDLVPFADVMRDFFNRHMSYESLKVELAEIYVDALTADELHTIADFYETDVGQKVLAVMPQLMSEGMNLGIRRVQENLPELQQMIAAKIEALEAEEAAKADAE
jgi:hypothetical protein